MRHYITNQTKLRQHGLSRTPEYYSWKSMMNRCYSTAYKNTGYYGARGITVDKRWHDPVAFIEDMGARPENTTLDRIDPGGNYEPGNCRWATKTTQAINQQLRKDNKTGYRGVSMTPERDARTCGRYFVSIKTGDYYQHLGYFHDKEQAALAYDAAAIQVFGYDARPNILVQ